MCDLLFVCRVCLNKDIRGYNMDQFNLRQCYEQTIRAKVNDKDGLPRWFCYECAALLAKFHKFRERCFKGQLILKQICTGDIMYDRVGVINQYSEDLVSSIGIIITNRRVKTFKFKHKYSRDKNNENSSESVQNTEESPTEDMVLHEDEIILDNIIDNVKIKQEFDQTNDGAVEPDEGGILRNLLGAEKTSVNLEDFHSKKDTPNDLHQIDDNMDMNSNISSSDDENIALNEIIKSKNEINTLPDTVFNPKLPEDCQKNTKVKPKRFTVRKKSLDPKHWKKLLLNDDEATTAFKLRVNSSYYKRANYKCKLCLTGFSKPDMLARHMKKAHDESLGPCECKFCHHRFPIKWALNRHMLLHYSVYQCLRCDKQFKKNSAAVHDDVHSGKIRNCEYCGKEFKHSSTYYSHVRIIHRSAHICTICGDSFISKTGLDMHTKRKHLCETKPPRESIEADIYCAECDIKFVSRIAYDEHFFHSIKHGDDNLNDRQTIRTNTHKITRDWRIPTTCKYCDKHFATQADCRKHHSKEHSGIPMNRIMDRQICEVCGASISPGNIAKHMVTHTRERAHACSVCGKRFSQWGSVRIHYQNMHPEHPCPKYHKRKTLQKKKGPNS